MHGGDGRGSEEGRYVKEGCYGRSARSAGSRALVGRCIDAGRDVVVYSLVSTHFSPINVSSSVLAGRFDRSNAGQGPSRETQPVVAGNFESS
jgi:hypothetical protein